jgi:multidrug efflux pump subunit AcrA (membrane-fusion protein)
MRITATRVIVALGLLASAAGVAWLLMPRPIPVETAAVSKGRFVASIDEDGKTRVRERYVVAAPLAGRLTRVTLKAGDKVAADEVIAGIVPPPAPLLDPRSRREAEERLGTAEAGRERSKAVVERARAQADQAMTDLDRARMLAAQGATTVSKPWASASARLRAGNATPSRWSVVWPLLAPQHDQSAISARPMPSSAATARRLSSNSREVPCREQPG